MGSQEDPELKAQGEYVWKEQPAQDARTPERVDAEARAARAKRKEDPELQAQGEFEYSAADPLQSARRASARDERHRSVAQVADGEYKYVQGPAPSMHKAERAAEVRARRQRMTSPFC
jgi:hypothetical protein